MNQEQREKFKKIYDNLKSQYSNQDNNPNNKDLGQEHIIRNGIVMPDLYDRMNYGNKSTGLVDSYGTPIMKNDAEYNSVNARMRPTGLYAPNGNPIFRAALPGRIRDLVEEDTEQKLDYNTANDDEKQETKATGKKSTLNIPKAGIALVMGSTLYLSGCGGGSSTTVENDYYDPRWDGTVQQGNLVLSQTDINNVAMPVARDGYVNVVPINTTQSIGTSNPAEAYLWSGASTLPTSNSHVTTLNATVLQPGGSFLPAIVSDGRIIDPNHPQYNDKLVARLTTPGVYQLNVNGGVEHPDPNVPGALIIDPLQSVNAFVRVFGTPVTSQTMNIHERQAQALAIEGQPKIAYFQMDQILNGNISGESAAFQADANLVRTELADVVQFWANMQSGNILGLSVMPGADSSVLTSGTASIPGTAATTDIYLLRLGTWADTSIPLSPSMSVLRGPGTTSTLTDLLITPASFYALDRLRRGE